MKFKAKYELETGYQYIITWDFDTETDQPIPARRLDQELINLRILLFKRTKERK